MLKTAEICMVGQSVSTPQELSEINTFTVGLYIPILTKGL